MKAVAADYARRRAEEPNRGLAHEGVGGSNWISLGPTNGAGRMTAIAPHPTIDGTVYVGAAGGGVWKTTDGGSSWVPLTDGINDLSVGALAIAPSSPTVIYLGSGEGGYGSDFIPGIGLLKSTDGGASWSLPASVIATTFYRVSVHPTNPLELIIGTNEGGLRSTDGGTTWSSVISQGVYGDVTDIVRHPTKPQVLYAATWCFNSCAAGAARVLKSNDGGATWTSKSAGLPVSTSANIYERLSLAISPSSPLVLYAGTALYDSGSGDVVSHIYKTSDGGESWADLPAVSSSADSGVRHFMGNQSWYDNTLVVAPTDANRLVAGGVSYIRTADGGSSFASVLGPHADAHDLRYQGAILYIANDGGIWSSPDDGNTFSDRNAGLVTRQYYAMSNDPAHRNRVVAGAQDNGTNRRPDSGGTLWNMVIGGDGFQCEINPIVPSFAYGTLQYGRVFRTKNAGGAAYWGEEVTPPYPPDEFVRFYSVLAIDPSTPSTLYTGTNRVWKSSDGGGSWIPLPTTTTDGSTWPPWADVASIAVARTNGSILMAGGYPGVFRSTNGGASWVSASGGLPGELISTVEIDPRNPDISYVALATSTGQSVFRTTNGGASWESRSAGLPAFSAQVVRVDPTDSNTLYCGTDVGVYRSTDQGGSWTRFGTGIPNSSIHDLRILEDGSIIRAATHGRGVWELQVPPTGNTPPAAVITSPVGPQRVSTGTTLTFSGSVSDPDAGDTVTGLWVFPDTWETAAAGPGSSTTQHVFTRPGVFPVSLAALDNHGAMGNASVTVSIPEPADNCATPWVLPGGGPFPYTVLVNNEAASSQTSDPFASCAYYSDLTSLWFEFTPAASGTYEFSTCGGNVYLIALSAFTGSPCGPYTELVCSLNVSGCPVLAVPATSAQTLRIMISGVLDLIGTVGTFPLTVRATTTPSTAPRVTGISGSSGPTTGNTSVLVLGANFANGAAVSFGGAAATGVTFLDPTILSATTPPHVVGPVDVVVTNPDNTSGTLGKGFTYVPAAPVVMTNLAGDITQTGATLNGTVNADGTDTNVYFEFGLSTSYGSTTAVQSIGSGNGDIAVTQPLRGLVCNTVYHFRVVATNVGGTTRGADKTFTTGGCTPAAFYTVAPCRVADTRNPPGPSAGPALSANSVRAFPAAGICAIPPSATAIAINLAVFQPSDGGDLRVYPTGGVVPLASSINFRPGIVRANNAIVPIGAGGQISVQCDMPPGSSGSTNFFFDVYGYFE